MKGKVARAALPRLDKQISDFFKITSIFITDELPSLGGRNKQSGFSKVHDDQQRTGVDLKIPDDDNHGGADDATQAPKPDPDRTLL